MVTSIEFLELCQNKNKMSTWLVGEILLLMLFYKMGRWFLQKLCSFAKSGGYGSQALGNLITTAFRNWKNT